MSVWLDTILAKIANGLSTDPEVKKAVAEITAKQTALENTNKTLQDAINANDGFDSALAAKVTVLEAADVEHQAVLDKIIEELQKGNTAEALAIAEEAQP